MLSEHFVWKGISERTIEKGQFVRTAGQLTMTSRITGKFDGKELDLSYEVMLDESWNTKSFTVENHSSERHFYFTAQQYEKGKWKNERNEIMDAFDNCLDIDIFPTPFTNTLPLKRHPLRRSETQEFLMLWMDLLEGQVRADRQRYQRLERDVYRFTSLDTNFTTDIEFTDDAFVKFYPDLFQLSERSLLNW